ncbi:MAG: type II toxin-antitoxin system RelE/ParE family toxin [Thaumarchaeota archaeon]|nr:type II toxin-antitoxin system RelE/ParE family toxin [Nitrososphaerota archaeon]
MPLFWTVIYAPKAEKDLEGLGEELAKKVILLMDKIALDPYRLLEKMTNSPFYKFRIGVYRGIVDIVNDKLILHLVKIKHRSQVYKK